MMHRYLKIGNRCAQFLLCVKSVSGYHRFHPNVIFIFCIAANAVQWITIHSNRICKSKSWYEVHVSWIFTYCQCVCDFKQWWMNPHELVNRHNALFTNPYWGYCKYVTFQNFQWDIQWSFLRQTMQGSWKRSTKYGNFKITCMNKLTMEKIKHVWEIWFSSLLFASFTLYFFDFHD